MPTTPFPGRDWPVEYEHDTTTVGSPMILCRVTAFQPTAKHAIRVRGASA